MTKDVYAADNWQSTPVHSQRNEATVLCASADADPDVLLRIAVALNLLFVAPERVLMEKQIDGTVIIEALVKGSPPEALQRVCGKLR